MTQRTQRKLSIARQLRGIDDRLIDGLRSARCIQLSVFFAWSMTTLARDAEYVISSSIAIREAGVCYGIKRRCVALETTRHNGPAELDRSIAIARTIDPACYFGPVGNRKLKELI